MNLHAPLMDGTGRQYMVLTYGLQPHLTDALMTQIIAIYKIHFLVSELCKFCIYANLYSAVENSIFCMLYRNLTKSHVPSKMTYFIVVFF